MTNNEKVTAVALHLQPTIGMLNSFFDGMVGRGQHELILLVGAGDNVQFASNTKRERSVLMLQDLLARWSIGMPDTMPDEVTSGNLKPFEYLLNEWAAAPSGSAAQKFARSNLDQYVGGMVAKVARSQE